MCSLRAFPADCEQPHHRQPKEERLYFCPVWGHSPGIAKTWHQVQKIAGYMCLEPGAWVAGERKEGRSDGVQLSFSFSFLSEWDPSLWDCAEVCFTWFHCLVKLPEYQGYRMDVWIGSVYSAHCGFSCFSLLSRLASAVTALKLHEQESWALCSCACS